MGIPDAGFLLATGEQMLIEQREKMQAVTNEELLKQQKRLEELYELHYRDKLQQQGEKQFEGV
jgi:hypothetical protein